MDPTHTLTAVDEDPASTTSPATYLAIAFDCARPLLPPARILLDTAHVVIGRGPARGWTRKDDVLRVELPDGWISSAHARLVREGTRWFLEDAGSKNGTLLRGRRVGREELADGDVIELGANFLVFRTVKNAGWRKDELAREPSDVPLPETLHPSWANAVANALRVAESSAAIFLVGETGTGKEILARAIHSASGRTGPFVPVNCGAIVRTLIESEIFGVRRGAFSGADEDRLGLLRAADGGTLMLDEVAELPESSQVVLLRVLQEHEVLPVGETRAVPIDVRIIAAAQQDLTERIPEGRFRADLYARLAGHVVRLPRLVDRIEDLGLLIAQLLWRLAGPRAQRLTLSRVAARALFGHRWPFNIRELEQALRSAISVATGDELGLDHLPEAIRAQETVAERAPATPAPDRESSERDRIVAALEACAGNQTRAARALGISRATLVNKLAIHRVPRPRKPDQ